MTRKHNFTTRRYVAENKKRKKETKCSYETREEGILIFTFDFFYLLFFLSPFLSLFPFKYFLLPFNITRHTTTMCLQSTVFSLTPSMLALQALTSTRVIELPSIEIVRDYVGLIESGGKAELAGNDWSVI